MVKPSVSGGFFYFVYIYQKKAMATVQYGAIITGMKGKIGGTVFQGGSSGQTAKTIDGIRDSAKLTKADAGRVINTLPLTASIAGAWRDLTDAQRDSWATGAVNYPAYNRYGVSYTPTGYQVFMTLNFQVVASGGTLLTECPVPITVPDLTDFGITWVPSTAMNLTFSVAIPSDIIARVEATQPMSLGKRPKNSFYKVIAQYDDAATSPTNMLTAYQNVYGAVAPNAKLYFRITYYSLLTGQKGVPVVIEVTT